MDNTIVITTILLPVHAFELIMIWRLTLAMQRLTIILTQINPKLNNIGDKPA